MIDTDAGAVIDASLFDVSRIDAETAALNARIEAALAVAPTILDVPAHVARAARVNGRSFLGPVTLLEQGETFEIIGPGGRLPLRVMRAAAARGVYLHIHGGGWALGAHDQQDAYLKAIADSTGLTAISIGYRLAPEHPFPAAPDDCEAAALWLLDHLAEFGGDVLAIGGESAGAHLAVLTLLRLRDRHGITPFRAAALSFGCYDLTPTPSAANWGARNLVLSTPIIHRYLDWFVPDAAQRSDPAVSPLRAALHGLPPALFAIGTLDPLLDDSLFMSARWAAAGNHAELAVYAGGMHAFIAMPTALAEQANRRQIAFLQRWTQD
ncbi:MAG: alpha/beta hydrolase [Variovorax sp.]|nr:MAG: alpha/beta hydrolase [Variovorax sp.]